VHEDIRDVVDQLVSDPVDDEREVAGGEIYTWCVYGVLCACICIGVVRMADMVQRNQAHTTFCLRQAYY
jgi:hypothetical protein